jgi:aminoglycoside phosphotransferase (APT) family kinase protein
VRLAAELGAPVRKVRLLGEPRPNRMTWAVGAHDLGELVVKARLEDWAGEKTRWCAAHLPLLGRRGYPVPEIVWHGALEEGWYLVVQRRLAGSSLRSLDARLLDAMLELVELQADAGIGAEERDFAAYQALVLFEGWDHVWRDAEVAAPRLCARVRRWLEPVWGLRLPARDFANNDLNVTNVLADGATITGVVDWDEFGLNSRAADLVALAFDCERLRDAAAVAKLLDRIVEIAGEDGLRCLMSYRTIAHVSARVRRGEVEGVRESIAAAERLLDRLGAA